MDLYRQLFLNRGCQRCNSLPDITTFRVPENVRITYYFCDVQWCYLHPITDLTAIELYCRLCRAPCACICQCDRIYAREIVRLFGECERCRHIKIEHCDWKCVKKNSGVKCFIALPDSKFKFLPRLNL